MCNSNSIRIVDQNMAFISDEADTKQNSLTKCLIYIYIFAKCKHIYIYTTYI